jgi:gamma-glutamyltranspeptidase/glutathione hydrolase
MMAPTLVLRDGEPELVVGSAGSNRIRAAILQVIVGVVDRGLDAAGAVEAPRLHWEDSVVYLEPGLDEPSLEAAGHTLARFRAPNLFFGGADGRARPGHGRDHGGRGPAAGWSGGGGVTRATS